MGRANLMKSRWARVYLDRMRSGLECCRNCGARHSDSNPLTFGHLVSYAVTKSTSFDSVTILCQRCNYEQGSEIWPHLISLFEEERTAPVERQWGRCAPDTMAPLTEYGVAKAKDRLAKKLGGAP